jgi:hypothetical protein
MEEKWPVLAVNLNTIVGGVVGVVSLFMPWVVRNGSHQYSLIDVLEGGVNLGMALEFLLPLVTVIFLLGTGAVFISPYGAAAQIGGAAIALFIVNIAALGNTEDQTISAGLGPYVGLISGTVVFLSIIFPFGLGYGHWKPLGNRGRNYTFSFYRDLNDSDGMPYWWWARGPGWFWYWWFEMRMGWAFRDAWEQHQRRKATAQEREEGLHR